MMRQRPTTIQTQKMKISEVKSRLNSLVNDVCREQSRILVEKSGIPVAALVSIADLQRLALMDEEDREAREVLEAMREPFRDVPAEEIERETERILAKIRAEDRAERSRSARFA